MATLRSRFHPVSSSSLAKKQHLIPGQDDPLPEGEDKSTMVEAMFDLIAPRYDLINRIMTFGLDLGWRKSTIDYLLLPTGSLVVDVGCGTGDLCRYLTARGYNSIGVDLSSGMLASAHGCPHLIRANVEKLPLPNSSCDGATSGFALRNFASLSRVFAELARVIRPRGRLSMLEVSIPSNPLLKAGHTIYFNRIVPLIGSLLSDKAAYKYLPRSVEYLPPSWKMEELLLEAGFTDIAITKLHGGIAQVITASRASS
ncbi:MAG: ubiquinone/menaquinone biosynthesis methyltransferase [Actinobacteria bacterium]|nr:ubiquinone/menaquinone biosynthesis methyltransferase [Actinomycetota bacterium]